LPNTSFTASRFPIDSFPAVEGHSTLKYVGGALFENLISLEYIAGTSTVVYRADGFSHIRFPTAFSVSEDRVFFLEITRLTDRVIASDSVVAAYGEGVNIFHGVAWGTAEKLQTLSDEIQARRYLNRQFYLKDSLKEIYRARIRTLRIDYWLCVFHLVARLKIPTLHFIRQILKDPKTLLYLPLAAVRALA
jgi:succinoglycan biosynthesis protein ExoW